MAKSKLTLVIDGNWLLMSRLSVQKNRYGNTMSLMQDVKALMVKSIGIVLRTFPQIDDIILVMDNGSWRKDTVAPDHHKEYKSNRVKSPEYDWNIVFSEFGKFTEVLEKNGVTTLSGYKVEGDDWCWYVSRTLNSQGTNVIIWSSDKDLTQLVSSDSNGCFTVIWNSKAGVCADCRCKDDLTNFLMNPVYQQNEQLLNSICARTGKVSYISPVTVQLDKAIRGDISDNIAPAITKCTKDSTRVYKVSAKHLSEDIDLFNEGTVREWVGKLFAMKQYAGKVNESLDQAVRNIMYNRTLVVLDERSYPEDVLDTIRQCASKITHHPLCNTVANAEAQVLAEWNNTADILNNI